MTMVGAFVAEDGIVLIGDGRVNSLEKEIIKDDQVKLFQLSDLSVVLPANGASNNIDYIMDVLRKENELSSIVYVDHVTKQFMEYCEEWVETNRPHLTPIFTIAGYNFVSGIYRPKLYSVCFENNKWELYTVDNSVQKYIAYSPRSQQIHDHIDTLLKDTSDFSVSNMIKISLSALELSKNLNPQAVGGETSLWTLLPNRGLIKLNGEEISKFA